MVFQPMKRKARTSCHPMNHDSKSSSRLAGIEREGVAEARKWGTPASGPGNCPFETAQGRSRPDTAARTGLLRQPRATDELSGNRPTRLADRFGSGRIGLSAKAVPLQTARAILDPAGTASLAGSRCSLPQTPQGPTRELRTKRGCARPQRGKFWDLQFRQIQR